MTFGVESTNTQRRSLLPGSIVFNEVHTLMVSKLPRSIRPFTSILPDLSWVQRSLLMPDSSIWSGCSVERKCAPCKTGQGNHDIPHQWNRVEYNVGFTLNVRFQFTLMEHLQLILAPNFQGVAIQTEGLLPTVVLVTLLFR